MFRRRRRNRGRWFPVTNVLVADSASFGTPTAGVRGTSFDIFGVFGTGDTSSSAFAGGAGPLASQVGPGSSYLVKRIVGEVHISAFQLQANDSHGYVGFGIFVDRTDETGSLLRTWTMFGEGMGATPSATASQDIMRRWMFRRTWHLGNSASTVAGRDMVFPPYDTGWQGSGLHQGPHIDVKVKARVSPQERLWFGIFLQTGSGGVVNGTPFSVTTHTSLRIFATPTMYDNR